MTAVGGAAARDSGVMGCDVESTLDHPSRGAEPTGQRVSNPRARGGLAGWLRAAVARSHLEAGRDRWRWQARVWPLDVVGVPAGVRPPDLIAGSSVEDHALRVDLLTGQLLRDPREGLAEIIRSGPLEMCGSDLAWWRSWRVACGIADRPIGPLVVVTPLGWLDVQTEQVVPLGRRR